ncbi:stage III sporulation protein AA [Alkaliphilus peptidifermentans]|uniref:Stage III sporulation protein AA n=1 Tax=Alkaliphilus peptidifermentans DSM 18978 TaxID=1120976 RepID=A0A1G5KEU3_9FIRM|nr:stage III sporulation protein AA [Alkaliphilus peptidifermentans]SCY98550.1 stage III sporulation protein AA [Alkaliphilus peptidifermentans DSM 18978]
MKKVVNDIFVKKIDESQIPLQQVEESLCPEIRGVIKHLPVSFKNGLEEIRMRVNQPLMVYGNDCDYFVGSAGQLLLEHANGIIINKKNIDNTLQFISNYSIYAVEEELKRGYITIKGGHRIGITGKIISDSKGIKTMKDFSGLNIRISREKKGAAKLIIPYIYEAGEFLNTLIISPPQCGKTTLLRDIIRNISNGNKLLGLKGLKVGVVDERSELGASCQGIPQLDLGIRTDLLDTCPKAEGMMMLIRAMSPQVIATDEIGKDSDSVAIEEALKAGIKLITTVHGKSIEDLYGKKVIGDIVKSKIFKRIIILSNRNEVGTIEAIYEGEDFKNLINSPIRNKVVN